MRRRACRFFGVLGCLLAAALVLLARVPIVAAVTEVERSFLSLYFTPEELSVFSTTRSLKSIDRIAENVQVVTAADIAMLNAHSVDEALVVVTGLAIETRGGPGSVFTPSIQGSSFTQVAAFLDGIPLNNLGSGFPELTFLPVEEVARIEVIKGPASSAWGSALGGVINIITKTPQERAGHAGTAYASYGEDDTSDLRVNIAGRVGGFGYGLWGGRLSTDGLTDGFAVDRKTLTAKFDYRTERAFNLGLALYYTGSDRGEGDYPNFDETDSNQADHLRTQLTGGGLLPGGGQASFNLWGAWNEDTFIGESLSDGSELWRYDSDETLWGGDLRYQQSWAGHSIVLGGEFRSGRATTSDYTEELSEQHGALFGNDTFGLGRATFTAGIRWDDLESAGSFWSPSLGVVYPLRDHLLLRAYVGRGFTAPLITSGTTVPAFSFVGNPDLEVEEVLSYQGGVEGDAPGLFWYKVTLFRHDVSNGIVPQDVADGNWTFVNKSEVRRQGVEIDVRSASFHGLTLEAGASLLDFEDRTSEVSGSWFAQSTYRAGLSYRGPRGLRALLNVHGIHWDTPEDYDPADDPLVDLHLGQTFPLGSLHLEVFASARNIFDGEQYFHADYPNPGRWLEAGVRCSF